MTGDEADRERAAARLRGLRIAMTRPADATDEFAEALTAEGAVVLLRPVVRIEPTGDEFVLRQTIARSTLYDWIVFTSATAVAWFRALGGEQRGARIVAVGPVTSAAAAAAGLEVHAVPEAYRGDAVVPAMSGVAPIAGARVFWPRAEGARRALSDALRVAGATVDELVLYRTIEDARAVEKLGGEVARGDVDVLTFTAPSAVRAYAAGCGDRVGGAIVAVIGPVTAAEARRAGMPVHVEPAEHTTAAMVASLRAFYEQSDSAQGRER